MKKLLISGAMSGSGKTTVSSILMSVLENVAPFKVGPDYIDPSYHELFTGNKSYNLDAYFFDDDTLKDIFESNSIGKEISIVEGVMGLYDGIGHEKNNYSTAHVSRLLDIPVILVVNAKGISTSIAAEVLGFKLFDTNVNIKGVILNNVSSEKLYKSLKEAIESYTGIQCVGYIPRNEKLSVESRHLGLKQAFEVDEILEKKKLFKEISDNCLDIKKILEIAGEFYPTKTIETSSSFATLKDRYKGKKVAIAKDGAFSFYYNVNIDLMKFAGMEIVEFSPVNDKKLPENIDLIYLGGGYPELYAEELSKNVGMQQSIKEHYNKGTKIYAECGGFIYLTKTLKQVNDETFDFVGLLDIDVEMKNRLNIQRFGYINILCGDEQKYQKDIKENILSIKGHEFHYSTISENREIIENCQNQEEDENYAKYFYNISKQDGRQWKCGFKKKNLLAGYPHISFASNINFLEYIIEKL